MPRKNNRLKDTPGSKIFDALTSTEDDVLASKLMAAAEAANHVGGRDNHDLVMETYDVVNDVQVARHRQRANGR